MKITIRKNLNIRRSPDTTSQKVGVILAGNEIDVEGIVNGEALEGNAKWYFDNNKNYYWSGGAEISTAPLPPITPQPSTPAAIFIDYSNWIVRDNPSINDQLRNERIRIAVLDSGLYEDHPDFKGALDLVNFPSVNCTKAPDVKDVKGHGTHVAGLIGARSDDQVGIIGVAPQSILRNIKVNDDSGNSSGDALLAGLQKINSNNTDIVNLSLDVTFKQYKQVEEILREISKFAVIVAAAGNNDMLTTQGDILYPAFSPFVISVGSAGPAFFSQNPNPVFNKRVDFLLPGFLLTSCSTKEKGFYAEDMGSSMATALVTGIIARIIRATGDKSPDAIRAALRAIAKPYSSNLDIRSLTLIKPS